MGLSIFFEEENLYKEPKEMYPIKSTNNDNINCFLSLTSQYKKNNTLITIKNETPRLSTDNKENVFGGKNGKANENSSKSATMTFMI
ncbi:hypothetical protein [Flavivirga spongiicola]|uniref:Uncharacterized protein n=1 Tax=Flavivirga spongiicola TaxID=421621 RepID=A0ABU7XW25_9FLAO|nr:hypothetical protein [Flavivirga sp. MEBiC05379]MDO5979974.1 hypothetical protein [Flavivirga sp. MEBiC05379]